MMKLVSAIVLVLFLSICPAAVGQVVSDQAEYERAFDARTRILIDSLSTRVRLKAELRRSHADAPENPANVMTTKSDRLDLMEAALLIRSGIDPDLGNELIREQAAQPFRGGMFYIHDVMASMLYAGSGVTDETRAAVRRSLKEIPIYRGDTENHYLLYYTGLFLAAETWPDEPAESWFNGRSSDENLADARSFIDHWIGLTTTQGQGEFDSPTYIIVFVGPLLSLRQFARDPIVKERAGKMLSWVLADYAAEYLNGLYAGGHSRDYSYDVVKPEGAPAVGWGWLFFGGPHVVTRADNLLAAWSDYRLPFIINNVANDRSKPYTHRERKRVRNIMRYGDRLNPPVYKTTYMTEDFALGSIQGGILQPIQQHTWDVTFVQDEPNATIFSLHPFYSGYELAMFFPEEIEWLTDQVDRYHLVYTDPDKWNSSSPYEQTFQHDNTLIVLYDIAEEAHHDHIDAFFPKTLAGREVDESGWIFADAGQTFIAVFPMKPFEWIEEDVGWRLRSNHRRNGLVVEADQARNHASFADFKAALRRTMPDLSALDEQKSVGYTTSSGDLLEFTFDGPRQLNGGLVELDDTPLFSGPFLNGADGVLTITQGNETLVLDLN